MVPTIQILILLLVIVASVAVAAVRLKIPPAILLVLTGVALALIPGLPTLQLSDSLAIMTMPGSWKGYQSLVPVGNQIRAYL